MVVTLPFFDPLVIARSGQCFRMTARGNDLVEAIAGGRRLRIRALGEGKFSLSCTSQAYGSFWRDYLDEGEDYAAIWRSACNQDAELARAAALYPGIRILRQDPWETLISFLLSQRKSIPAIRTCVEAICQAMGSPKGSYFAFPTPRQMLRAGEDTLRACGTGYRAPYLMDAARRVCAGLLPLEEMRSWPNGRILEALMQVKGVGVKVASCVLLYGYHRLDAWPVDVWVQRIIAQDYKGKSPFEGYGAYAGVYQQYLFLERLEREKRTPAPRRQGGIAQCALD